MHVVVIHNWKEETAEFLQVISQTLELTVYEVRQRLIGGSPTVLANFADHQQALVLIKKLNQIGIPALVIDATEVRQRANDLIVRRFELDKLSLHIEMSDGQHAEISYGEIDMLLPCTSIIKYADTKTVTERKFSLGKTLLAGGIPMSKKIEHQKDVSTEKQKKILFLYFNKRQQPVVFIQDVLTYDGLGKAMKISGELNFAHLLNELHRLCPSAVYDERLLKRLGQVRLLGPTLNPETNLDLAVDILARSLRPPQKNNPFVP